MAHNPMGGFLFVELGRSHNPMGRILPSSSAKKIELKITRIDKYLFINRPLPENRIYRFTEYSHRLAIEYI